MLEDNDNLRHIGQWQRIDALLQEALDRPLPERGAFLQEACAGDSDLNQEVTSLANAYDLAADFIEEPAIATDARVLLTLSDDNIGREIGSYTILELLGSGGMGDVYLAKDRRLNRLVALKILATYLSDETRLHRFHKEARAASALNHPNILTIYEVGSAESVRFIATEFIDGQTVRELIARKQLSIGVALDIAQQVCIALAAAHDAGIVHRDVKPENVMRRPDGIVKLLDFGIAKLTEPGLANTNLETSHTQTETGVAIGTVNYMSPEQARGLPVDARSDLWSLGVLLYEMLAYRLPFDGATRLDTMVAILEREPLPVTANTNSPRLQQLQSVVTRNLQKNADDRYQTATELFADLQNLAETLKADDAKELETALPEVSVPEVSVRRRDLVARVMQFGVVLLLVLVFAGGVVYQRVWKKPAAITVTVPKLYSGMSEVERLEFIDQQEQRISALMGDRPAKLKQEQLGAIKARVDRYVALKDRTEDHESLAVVYGRARPYLPTIARSFSERNVPLIIGIYLPMIESAYLPCRESPLGSKGLYQFLPQTAELYGVPRAEMCDAEKMTPAAAHYLADRMAEMGDDSQSLTLVVLSYTTGAEWVRETLRRLREEGSYERNFWVIFDNRDKLGPTAQQTSGYVPAFFAAAIIGENPSVFELPFPALSELATQESRDRSVK